MSRAKQPIIVFEHEVLKAGTGPNDLPLTAYEALEKHYGEKGVPYYNLVRNGVKFNEFVGVIQVGQTLIEVLPKADKEGLKKDQWRDVLIKMLKAVGTFDIHATGNSHLRINPNSILDLYFELFIKELEYLLHNGLIKQYRSREGNVTALKGSLQFAQHIQQNVTHQERFYVRHTCYDHRHTLHYILYKTLCLLKKINTNASLHSRIGTLLLHFPEMPDIKVSESLFEKLVFNCKNQSYQKAIDIARLLLLRYHPDLSKGRNHVLALMFDMNLLWERFVYVSLRKKLPAQYIVSAQTSKSFWKPTNGYRTTIRPDLCITNGKVNMILDTKWKNLNGYKPSSGDLQQLFAYHEFYEAKKVALVYPGAFTTTSGKFYTPEEKVSEKECSVISIAVEEDIKVWQGRIAGVVEEWMEGPAVQLDDRK